MNYVIYIYNPRFVHVDIVFFWGGGRITSITFYCLSALFSFCLSVCASLFCSFVYVWLFKSVQSISLTIYQPIIHIYLLLSHTKITEGIRVQIAKSFFTSEYSCQNAFSHCNILTFSPVPCPSLSPFSATSPPSHLTFSLAPPPNPRAGTIMQTANQPGRSSVNILSGQTSRESHTQTTRPSANQLMRRSVCNLARPDSQVGRVYVKSITQMSGVAVTIQVNHADVRWIMLRSQAGNKDVK